ncbi:MAG: FISUMP domain-containing protein [Bacteroidota bacterium]
MKFIIVFLTIVVSHSVLLAQNYVKIGKLYWADHNLITSTFSNGDSLTRAKNSIEWENYFKQGVPSYCSVGYNPTNDSIYGKIYNWWAVVDLRGLAPEGFMVPSVNDWMGLKSHLNYDTNCRCVPPVTRSADKLKSTSQWKGDLKGDNLFNMNVLPAGYIRNDGKFEGKGMQVSYWTCSPQNAANNIGDSYSTYYIVFKYDKSDFTHDTNFDANGHFVRCAKGQQEYFFKIPNATDSEESIENQEEQSETSEGEGEEPTKKKKRKKKS